MPTDCDGLLSLSLEQDSILGLLFLYLVDELVHAAASMVTVTASVCTGRALLNPS